MTISPNRRAARALTVLALLLTTLAATASRASADITKTKAIVGAPIYALSSLSERPPGFSIDGAQALAIAKTSRVALAIHRREHPLQVRVSAWLNSHYEIYMFFHGQVVADVQVSKTGRLGRTWTGPLIEAIYGRGDYAPLFDSPWVSVVFGLLFLLPFLSLRRRPRGAELDLAAVLAFGVSYSLFDHKHFEAAVWLAYAPLGYLLVRMALRGFRAGRARTQLRSWCSTRTLAVGLLGLVIARIVLALCETTPTDVGFASIVGAARIVHGLPLYYATTGHPDTYGPISYLFYVPFQLLFPWDGKWDYLLGVRLAAITFDLLTMGGLLLLGRRLRGGAEGARLGIVLAWLWAACPFTLLVTMRATNDALISLLLVAALLTITVPWARGALIGLGAAAKFVPGLLLPLLAVGVRRGGRDARVTLAACVIVTGASFALFLPPGGISEVWSHTLGFQLSRPDLFSIWGLHHSLAPLKEMLEVLGVALALLVAVRPRGERSLPQVAALMAVVLIAAQLVAVHWFYFYIAWFLPAMLVAVAAGDRPRPGTIWLDDRGATPAGTEGPSPSSRVPATIGAVE